MLEVIVFLGAFAGVAAIWGAVFLMIRGRLRQAAQARAIVEGDRVTIPLVAAFAALRGAPLLAAARNSMAPRLVLHADRVEVKVLRTRFHPYERITNVDYRSGIGTRNVMLTFSDTLFLFAGNTANEALARDVISRLKARGCPLSKRAQALLEQG